METVAKSLLYYVNTFSVNGLQLPGIVQKSAVKYCVLLLLLSPQ